MLLTVVECMSIILPKINQINPMHLSIRTNSIRTTRFKFSLKLRPILEQFQPNNFLRDDVHTHFATPIVKWTIVGGWVKPLDDKRSKVGRIKS